MNDNISNRIRAIDRHLAKWNLSKEKLTLLKTDIENNVPHALMWYNIMSKRASEAKTAYKAALYRQNHPYKRKIQKKVNFIKYLPAPPDNQLMNDDCAICLNKSLVKDSILTNCNHQFCFDCFDNLRKISSTIIRCPCCRTPCLSIKAYK